MIITIALQARTNRRFIKFSYTDEVTGGLNSYSFTYNVTKKLRKRRIAKYAMVLFDVEKFKVINDLYGHARGDALLRAIHSELSRWCTKNEICARCNADEFRIFAEYIDEATLRMRIKELADRMQSLVGIKHLKYYFGVFVINDKRLDFKRICDFASVAQDVVKKNKSSHSVAFFDDRERVRILNEQEIELTMEEALKNEEFVVYLQPKYSVETHEIQGAEALVRWKSANGFRSPAEFIPVFEKNNFIIQLDKYMLEKVCQKQREWLDLGEEVVPISVNISRAHFRDANIVNDIMAIVDKYSVPHNLIEIGLTESAFFDNKEAMLTAVADLQKNGFIVSMDDFGAGYSSLNSLKDLPLDVIKLDGEFFSKTNNDKRSKTVVRDTIALAKNLKMKIVAEGIETKEQVDFLKIIGCDLIQGYYFSKPVEVTEYEKLRNYKKEQ